MTESLHDINDAEAKELYEAASNIETPVETRMQKLMQALIFAREAENQYLEAKILHRLGDTALLNVERVQYYEQSLTLSRQIDNIRLQAEFLLNMGNNAEMSIEERLTFYKQADTLAKQLHDIDFQAQISYHRGGIEKTIPQRLHCYNKAIGLVRISKNKELEARILLAYGEIDEKNQLHWYQEALDAAKESGNEALIGRINRLLMGAAVKALGLV